MPEHRGASAITIGNRHAARLQPGGSIEMPHAPFLHVFTARGDITVEGAGALDQGDAARITGAGGQRLTAVSPAEVLVWEMRARA